MSNTNTSTRMAVASASVTTPQAPPPTDHHRFNLIKANHTRTLERRVCPPRGDQISSVNEVIEGRLTHQQRRVLIEAWRREYLEEEGGCELMEGAAEQGGPGALLTLSGVLFEAMVGRPRNFFYWRRDKKGKRKFCGPSALDRNLHKLWMTKFWPARVILKRTNKEKKVSKQEKLARKKFAPKRSPLRQVETVEYDMGTGSDVDAGDLDEYFDTSSIDTQPFDELEYRSRLAMLSGEEGLVVDGEKPQSDPDSKVNATEPGPETPSRGGTQPTPLPTPPPTLPDEESNSKDEAPSRRPRSNSWTPPDSSLTTNWMARSKRKRDDAAEDSASFSFKRSRSDVWDPNASFYDVSTSSQFLKSNSPCPKYLSP